MEINLSRLSSAGSVVFSALMVNFPPTHRQIVIGSDFLFTFFFGRAALSSLRQNQDTYLTDTKIRKSLFDGAGELFNEITNRLIIVEIFYAIILD